MRILERKVGIKSNRIESNRIELLFFTASENNFAVV